jgi:hypothetical protein
MRCRVPRAGNAGNAAAVHDLFIHAHHMLLFTVLSVTVRP